MLFHRLTDSWHFCWLSRHGKSNTTAPRRSFGYGGLDLQRHFYCDSTNVSFQYQSKEILKDLQSKRVFRMPSIGESFIPKPMLDTKLQHSYFQMCLYNDTIKGSNLLTIIIADGFALNLPDYPYFCLLYCSTSFLQEQNGSEYSKQKRLLRSIPPTCPSVSRPDSRYNLMVSGLVQASPVEPTSIIRRKVIGFTNTLGFKTIG